MKNLIYQFWNKDEITTGTRASSRNIKEYADRIGAEYLFEHKPNFVTNLGGYSPHYGRFKPIYDKKFEKYDNILVLDIDIFAVDGLKENIFEQIDTNTDIGICTEPWQPQWRKKDKGHISGENDERWARVVKNKWKVDMPRNEEGLLKVYNSGVILYSRQGLDKAKKNFVPFKEYVDLMRINGLSNFYGADQNYIHAMMHVVKGFKYKELHNGWNSYMHFIGRAKDEKTRRPINDTRTDETKFCHIQLSCADYYKEDLLWKIVNRPKEEWEVLL